MSVDERYDAIIEGERFLSAFSAAAQARDSLTLLECIAEAAAIIAPHVICRKGCSHCCHMATIISEREAEAISAHIGAPHRKLRHVPLPETDNERNKLVAKYRGAPCAFLEQDGSCGIYEARPVVCRTQFNLADTPDICNVATEAKVPNIDWEPVWAAYCDIHFLTQVRSGAVGFGDIRDYFPKGQPCA